MFFEEQRSGVLPRDQRMKWRPGLEPNRGLTWQMTKRRDDSEVHEETEEKPEWCSDLHVPPYAAFVESRNPTCPFPGMETVEAAPARDQAQLEVNLFNRWSFEGVQVADISLSDYIGVQASRHATYVPHTAGRYSVKRFRKAQCPIVERLTNSLMMHGRNNGKKLMATRIVKHAMEIIYILTDQNPIQVIVDAVINSGPHYLSPDQGCSGRLIAMPSRRRTKLKELPRPIVEVLEQWYDQNERREERKMQLRGKQKKKRSVLEQGVEHFNAEEYVKLVRKYGLEISQPGLEPNRGLTWQMTKRMDDSEVHEEPEEKPEWRSDLHVPPYAAFVERAEAAPARAQAQLEVKLFNRWRFEGVQVDDISLSDYIGVQASKHATYVPHTSGRITKHAMEIIYILTDQNPIQVIVDAVINSGPREDATGIGYAAMPSRRMMKLKELPRPIVETMTNDLPERIQRGDEEIWFHFPPAYTCFGREEFCLITGLCIGHDEVTRYTSHISRPSWLSRVFPELAKSKPSLHVDDLKRLFVKDGFTRMDDLDVVRIWIFEAFPSMRAICDKNSNDIPRAITWRRIRLLDWEERPTIHYRAELASDWWQASKRFFNETDDEHPLLREPSPDRADSIARHPEPSPDRASSLPPPSLIPSYHRAFSPLSPYYRRPTKRPQHLSPCSPPQRDELGELRDEVGALRHEVGTLREENSALRDERPDEVDGLHPVCLAQRGSRIRRRTRAITSPFTPLVPRLHKKKPDASIIVQEAPSIVQEVPLIVSEAPPTVQEAPVIVQEVPPTVQEPDSHGVICRHIDKPPLVPDIMDTSWLSYVLSASTIPQQEKGTLPDTITDNTLWAKTAVDFYLHERSKGCYSDICKLDDVIHLFLDRSWWGILLGVEDNGYLEGVGWSSHLAKYLNEIDYWTNSGNKKPKKFKVTMIRDEIAPQQTEGARGDCGPLVCMCLERLTKGSK
ncbi:40S ribosomal protein S5 [Hibiscus syriacus]|uniref:40S ribosomal protein S5 n=1 Tax=Hibiscus syriacus TaxID=106335 RepID=A0A6A3A229_HIBSY|nr:40S ribosomal protein S5 [Hibiscus syriacus]